MFACMDNFTKYTIYKEYLPKMYRVLLWLYQMRDLLNMWHWVKHPFVAVKSIIYEHLHLARLWNLQLNGSERAVNISLTYMYYVCSIHVHPCTYTCNSSIPTYFFNIKLLSLCFTTSVLLLPASVFGVSFPALVQNLFHLVWCWNWSMLFLNKLWYLVHGSSLHLHMSHRV